MKFDRDEKTLSFTIKDLVYEQNKRKIKFKRADS